MRTTKKKAEVRAVALYARVSIRRFQAQVKEVFLGGDNGLTRNYLRFLLDEIVVDGKELRVFARSNAALRMMAGGGDGGEPPARCGRSSHYRGGLARVRTNATQNRNTPETVVRKFARTTKTSSPPMSIAPPANPSPELSAKKSPSAVPRVFEMGFIVS